MNIKELSNLFYINKEIKRLESELEEITEIGSSVIDGMPHGTKSGDKVQQLVLKRQTLVEKIVKKQIEYIDEKIRMENFIANIDDAKIKHIVALRFVEFKSWYEIADEITPDNKELVDRTAPYNAIKRYFEKNSEMTHMSHR
jgi:hypothetical protein